MKNEFLKVFKLNINRKQILRFITAGSRKPEKLVGRFQLFRFSKFGFYINTVFQN